MTSPAPQSSLAAVHSRARVTLVAGEASGDAVGAALARELAASGDHELTGIGGPRMRAAGVHLFYDSSTWSCMGVTESLRMLPRMLGTFDRLKRELSDHPPAALVPIDFGAFNVPLSRHARRQEIPVLYFMPPRSWDRNPDRRHTVIEVADHIATPFPWSAEILTAAGGNATYVGHPLADVCQLRRTRAEAVSALGLDPTCPIVGLLPGSRLQEMKYVLPLCLLGAREVARRQPGVQFVLGPAPNVPETAVREQLRRFRMEVPLVREMAYDIMVAADALIIASGTATLEAACFGAPMVVVYDGPATGRLEFRLFRRHVEHVSLPNIIGGRQIVPELLGRSVATPEHLADEVLPLLEDSPQRRRMVSGLAEVRQFLGAGGAVRRTAELLTNLIACPPSSRGL